MAKVKEVKTLNEKIKGLKKEVVDRGYELGSIVDRSHFTNIMNLNAPIQQINPFSSQTNKIYVQDDLKRIQYCGTTIYMDGEWAKIVIVVDPNAEQDPDVLLQQLTSDSNIQKLKMMKLEKEMNDLRETSRRSYHSFMMGGPRF